MEAEARIQAAPINRPIRSAQSGAGNHRLCAAATSQEEAMRMPMVTIVLRSWKKPHRFGPSGIWNRLNIANWKKRAAWISITADAMPHAIFPGVLVSSGHGARVAKFLAKISRDIRMSVGDAIDTARWMMAFGLVE